MQTSRNGFGRMDLLDDVAHKARVALRVAVNAYWEYKPLYTLRRLTTRLDDIPINRPVFLLGVQGGGLTLLTRILHRHPCVVTIGGGRRYWVGNNEMDKQYIRDLPEALTLRSPGFTSPVFKTHMTGAEERHPVFGRERSWVYACNDLVDRYRQTGADYTPAKAEALQTAIRESLRAYAISPTKARFLDMSQTFILKIPLLQRIFPDARFVIQTRDPYATCYKEATDLRYAWRQEASMGQKLQVFAENWVNSYRFAVQDLEDDPKALFIRYEDLTAAPEDAVRAVTDSIDLPLLPDMLPQLHHTLPWGSTESHKWYPIRENVNDKHRAAVSDEHAQRIRAVVHPLAEKFGYAPPEPPKRWPN